MVVLVLVVCCIGLYVLVLIALLGFDWLCGFWMFAGLLRFGSCCVMFAWSWCFNSVVAGLSWNY